MVCDGAAALDSTASTEYDVIVLDRDLPAVHGDRVCRLLVRDGSPGRILMLTAAADVEDRVDGAELNATVHGITRLGWILSGHHTQGAGSDGSARRAPCAPKVKPLRFLHCTTGPC